jgi:hypothetical protein
VWVLGSRFLYITDLYRNRSRRRSGLLEDAESYYHPRVSDEVRDLIFVRSSVDADREFSEPDNNFDDGDPTTLCGQEGMQVYPNQRAQVVEALASAFRAANLTTAVIADESSSTGTSSSIFSTPPSRNDAHLRHFLRGRPDLDHSNSRQIARRSCTPPVRFRERNSSDRARHCRA